MQTVKIRPMVIIFVAFCIVAGVFFAVLAPRPTEGAKAESEPFSITFTVVPSKATHEVYYNKNEMFQLSVANVMFQYPGGEPLPLGTIGEGDGASTATAVYEWQFASVSIPEESDFKTVAEWGNTRVYSMKDVKESGTYRVRVRVTHQTTYQTVVGTSLWATYAITIHPKEITAVFNNMNLTYNGKAQAPTVQKLDEGTLFEAEVLTFTQTGDSGELVPASTVDANPQGVRYYAKAVSKDENYRYVGNNVISEFVIRKYVITPTWTGEKDEETGMFSFVYNREVQHPLAVADGLLPEERIAFTYKNAQADATPQGETYVVEAAVAAAYANNYAIALGKNTQSYIITPQELLVEWGELSLSYQGSVQYPTPFAYATNLGNVAELDKVSSDSGIDVRDTPYSAVAVSINPNYKLKGGTTEYRIVPYQTSLLWKRVSPYNAQELFDVKIDTQGVWRDDYVFTYQNMDLLRYLGAQFLTIDGSPSSKNDVELSVVGGSTFQNAGTYQIKAALKSSVKNYSLEDYGMVNITVPIAKATSTVLLEQLEWRFVEKEGVTHQISATANNKEQSVILTHNGSVVPNAFAAAGRYLLSVHTAESANYQASPKKSAMVEVCPSSIVSEEGVGIYCETGVPFGATAKLVTKELSNEEIAALNLSSVRHIQSVQEFVFVVDGAEVPLAEVATIKMKSPVLDAKNLRILVQSDGKMVEKVVEVDEEGYFSVELNKDGTFIITTIDATVSLYWWLAIVGAVLLIVAIVVLFVVSKRKRSMR